MKAKKKVLVGMSGGVDSSVAAALLIEQGYEVIGIHLRFWNDPTLFSPEQSAQFPQNKCCTLEGLNRTRRVAHKLGIPFYILNFEDSFKHNVVDYFIEGYEQGITPNPCIECNRSVKFGLFLDKMRELGADYVATGHYARNTPKRSEGASSKNKAASTKETTYQLRTAKDTTKDQSYFLYTLTQEKLKHILFPIGDYTKPQIRELAKKFGIDEVNNQKESQNLCFFPEKTHDPFLRRHIEKKYFAPGPIKTMDGQTIGQHEGLPTYTIGQRKGLGIGGVKNIPDGTIWYVIKIDRPNNALIVGNDTDLMQKTLTATNLTFVSGAAPGPTQKIHAKIRARFPGQPASIATPERSEGASSPKSSPTITNHNESTQPPETTTLTITFEKPQRAITPGQSVVLYEGDTLLGGGIIV